MKTLGYFGLIFMFAVFWIFTPWWFITIGLALVSIIIGVIKVTWDVAELGQKQIEKLDNK